MLKITVFIVAVLCLGSALASYGGNYNDPYAPNFPAFQQPFLDPFEFHNQLSAYINGQQFLQNSGGGVGGGAGGTYTYASPGGSAYAATSLYPDNESYYNQKTNQYEPYDDQRETIFQENFARQQAFFNALQRQAQYNSGAGSFAGSGAYAGPRGTGTYGSRGSGSGLYSGSKQGGGGYAPNYAFASGSTSGGKHYGTAAISPSNSKSPNIHSRFGGDGNPGGFHSVSSSSFSESSNVNGQEHSRRGGQTTFNDNGKITTYKVHS